MCSAFPERHWREHLLLAGLQARFRCAARLILHRLDAHAPTPGRLQMYTPSPNRTNPGFTRGYARNASDARDSPGVIGMLFQPVSRDLDATRQPDLGLFRRVFQEALERREPPGSADDPAMQSHRHHARRVSAFFVKNVEAVLQVGVELLARIEALGRSEAHVVRIQSIRDDELRLAVARIVEREFVAVVVGVVYEAAVLDHQRPGVRAGAPRIPSERPLAGEAPMNIDRAPHVPALRLDRHVLVVDPAPAMARDLVARF